VISDRTSCAYFAFGTHPAANLSAICEAITFNQNIVIERKAARLRYRKDRWATQLAKT
jgi:isopenicillin-N epimerase